MNNVTKTFLLVWLAHKSEVHNYRLYFVHSQEQNIEHELTQIIWSAFATVLVYYLWIPMDMHSYTQQSQVNFFFDIHMTTSTRRLLKGRTHPLTVNADCILMNYTPPPPPYCKKRLSPIFMFVYRNF